MMKKITFLIVLFLMTFSFADAQNLALGKTADASSATQAASNSVDGNMGTRWESASSDPQWISIDLGESYSIGQVILKWEGAYAKQYKIEVSENNTDWTVAYTETSGDGNTDDISLTSTGRYIRMYGTERGTIYGYSLWELEVYEAISAEKDATLAGIKVDNIDLAGFNNLIETYKYGVVEGTTVVPTVTAMATNSNANVVVTEATAIPGSTTILVTSEDQSTQKTYTVNFVVNSPNSTAPAPTKNAADVISVYSDTYTSIYTDLNPAWGQATVVTEKEIESNKYLEYAGLNFQGMNYTQTDVSNMEYLHFDYWTGDATALTMYLISTGKETGSVVTLQKGKWVSVDLPLSVFTNPDLTAVNQFKAVGNSSGTIYFDNFYFWKEPAAQGTDASLSELKVDDSVIAGFSSAVLTYNFELPYGTTTVPTVTATATDADAMVTIFPATSIPGNTTVEVKSQDETVTTTYTISFKANILTEAAPIPAVAPANVIPVYSDTYPNNIYTDLNPGWGQMTVATEVVIGGNNTLKYAGLNYQGLVYANTDVSAMKYLNFDYWTADATSLELFLIADGENSYDVTTELGITIGQWTNVQIPLSYYSNAGRDLTQAIQFKTQGNGTVYMDNFYFSKDPTTDIQNLAQFNFRAYPNPTTEFVKLAASSTIESVQILDLAGRVVLRTNPNNNTETVNVNALPTGVYVLKVSIDGVVGTSKLLKK